MLTDTKERKKESKRESKKKESKKDITSSDIIARNGRVLRVFIFIVWLHLLEKYKVNDFF